MRSTEPPGAPLVAQVGVTVDEDLAESTSIRRPLPAGHYRGVVGHAATKGALKEGLDVDAATEVLVAMLSPVFSMELVTARGWGDPRAIEWLADTLSHPSLCPSIRGLTTHTHPDSPPAAA